MKDNSKPWVMTDGITTIGYDPGDRESKAAMVKMVFDPKTGITTVTDVQTWSPTKPPRPR